MADWTRERIVEAAKKADRKGNGPLSLSDFCRRCKIHDYYIYRLFPEGGWTEIRQLAGIARHPRDKDPMSDEQLLQEFHRVILKLGALPSWPRFAFLATVSSKTMQKRFGSRGRLLERYRDWLEKNEPESPLLPLVRTQAKPEPVATASPAKVLPIVPQAAKGAGVVFGSPMEFRGLRHAPTNEHGVIYLFGMVSSELGLIVEAIQSAYPDCEAKRCIDRKEDRWQRVRIEFEFSSNNFRAHGHDPAGCDLIVCWEHDWRECPLEVIELRSVVERLNNKRYLGQAS